MTVPKWLRIALTLVLLAASGLWAFLHSIDPMYRCRGHRAFATTAWRDSVQAYGTLAVRGCMVDDLLARHRLQGVPREDVVTLLGEPRPTSYFRDYDLVYWLGPERGWMSVDSEWLVFRLDAAGRVAAYRLITD
jgi:hypothetical protein